VSDVRVERWHPGDGDLTARRVMRVMELEGYDVILYTYRSRASCG
jgi:hypothetical protein